MERPSVERSHDEGRHPASLLQPYGYPGCGETWAQPPVYPHVPLTDHVMNLEGQPIHGHEYLLTSFSSICVVFDAVAAFLNRLA